MPTLHTDRSNEELPATAADTWSRSPGVKVTGDLTYKEAVFTVATPATGDAIRICKIPANAIVIPHLCKIVAEALGTAFNISKIGDLAVDGSTDANDDDRYSGAVNITAGGAFDFAHAAAAAGLAGYRTLREMWLTATLGTITAPTEGKKIRFVIAYAVPT